MISVGTGEGGPTMASVDGVGRSMSEVSAGGLEEVVVDISLCFLFRGLVVEVEVVVTEESEVLILRFPATPVGMVICKLEERWRPGDGICVSEL